MPKSNAAAVKRGLFGAAERKLPIVYNVWKADNVQRDGLRDETSIELSLQIRSLKYTVKPVLSGPVLNGHPLLSGQL